MHKNIGAVIVKPDEAKSAICIEELHPATWHGINPIQRYQKLSGECKRPDPPADGPGLDTTRASYLGYPRGRIVLHQGLYSKISGAPGFSDTSCRRLRAHNACNQNANPAIKQLATKSANITR